MPYKSEKIPIAGTMFDCRRKLSPDQKEAIVILSGEGYSQRKLAAMFHCSKRSIQNILHPQKRSPAKKRPAAYWTEKKREYRLRKQNLFVEGKLKPKTKKEMSNINYYEVDVCDEHRTKVYHAPMTPEKLVEYCTEHGLGVIVSRRLKYTYFYPKNIPFAIPVERFVALYPTTETHEVTSYGMPVGGPNSTFTMSKYIEVIPFKWNERFAEDIQNSINPEKYDIS